MEVHSRLGHGFLEAVYHAALTVELARSDIPFERERALAINYRDTVLPCLFRADLVCFGLLVELKANVHLGKADEAQIVNYLKASGLKKGLLLNFGSEKLEYRRFVF